MADNASRGDLLTAIVRDLAIVLGALSLWAGADAWYLATRSGFAAALSVADGLLVGLAVAIALHEWGHYAGARLSGGYAPLNQNGRLLPLSTSTSNEAPSSISR